MLSCEPIFAIGPYDYGTTDLASRARDAALALAFERGLVRPPPPEMLSSTARLGAPISSVLNWARASIRRISSADWRVQRP